MDKSLSYLRRYKDTIKRLAKKHGISEQEVINIIDGFFKTFKGFLTDWRMPTIKISNLGTFKPSIGKINWTLKNSFLHYRRGNMGKEKMAEKIQRVWDVKQRLIREKLGHSTWKEWRNKQKDAEK